MGNQYIKGQDPHHISGTDKFLCDDGIWKEIQGGSGGANIETITYEYYLAHKEEIEASDNPYIVSGDSEATLDAIDVIYSNSASGLASQTVQGAIDEIAQNSGGHTYSTTEQVVGTWIDGKPIYERVYQYPTYIRVSVTGWTASSIIIPDIDTVIYGGSIDLSKEYIPILIGLYATGELALCITSGATGSYVDINKIIVQYTKTTD